MTMGVMRKRGRPPTTEEYVGRAAAIQELARQERELLELQAERGVAEMALETRRTRASGTPSPAKKLGESFVKRKCGDAMSIVNTSGMGVRAFRSRALQEAEAVISGIQVFQPKRDVRACS